ncbi:MAG: PrgI family protein [Firmicutes bacterium]|nr:PrgI family protein [Bacillota bacterium]
MSIEVRVPEEIKDYKESIIAGLSIRQLACGAVAFSCGVPTFLILRNINMDLATYATMAAVVPAFCIGFIKKGGYTFEKYLKIKLKAVLGVNKRKYQTIGTSPPIEVEEYRAYYQELAAEQTKQEEQQKGGHKIVRTKGERNTKKVQRKKQREYEIAEISKKGYKRARKAAYKAIKKSTGVDRKEKFKKEEKS